MRLPPLAGRPCSWPSGLEGGARREDLWGRAAKTAHVPPQPPPRVRIAPEWSPGDPGRGRGAKGHSGIAQPWCTARGGSALHGWLGQPWGRAAALPSTRVCPKRWGTAFSFPLTAAETSLRGTGTPLGSDEEAGPVVFGPLSSRGARQGAPQAPPAAPRGQSSRGTE